MQQKIISASILSADFAKLGKDTAAAIAAGVDHIHFDVMDHHFVPNLSFGAVICKALRNYGITAPIDVHLMVEHPEQYIESFAEAGASLITFHPETVDNLPYTIDLIHHVGMKTGLAFNPDNHLNIDIDILKRLDLILLMSVYPGFAGQAFLNNVLDKIKTTRQLIEEHQCKAYLGVDGGIKANNIAQVAKAGADFFVVGSGLFKAHNYQERVTALRDAIQ